MVTNRRRVLDGENNKNNIKDIFNIDVHTYSGWLNNVL